MRGREGGRKGRREKEEGRKEEGGREGGGREGRSGKQAGRCILCFLKNHQRWGSGQRCKGNTVATQMKAAEDEMASLTPWT